MDFAEFFKFKTGDTSFKKRDTKNNMIRTALSPRYHVCCTTVPSLSEMCVIHAHHYLARYVIPVDVAMHLCEDAALAFRFLSESRGRN